MSEFSSSIHFMDNDIDKAKKLFQDESVPGVILGTNGTTLSALVDWEYKAKICKQAKIIDYSYAEDNGIWIRFYNNGKVVAKIVFTWGDDYGIEDENENNKPGITKNISDILVSNGFIQDKSSVDFLKLLDNFLPENYDEREDFLKKIGSELKISNFRWTSYQDIQSCLEDLQDEFPDMVIIE